MTLVVANAAALELSGGSMHWSHHGCNKRGMCIWQGWLSDTILIYERLLIVLILTPVLTLTLKFLVKIIITITVTTTITIDLAELVAIALKLLCSEGIIDQLHSDPMPRPVSVLETQQAVIC